MENIPLEKIIVELEKTEDGGKKLKRLESGAHPLDTLAEVLSEENEEFKAKYNQDLFEWGTYWEPGEKGERQHLIFVLYSNETGEKVPIRRFVMWDKKTDRPVPKPLKVPGKPGMRTMAKKDTLEHVGNFLDWKKIQKKMEERKLHVKAANSWDVLEKAKRDLEG